jgi:hypothetical protein
MNFTKFGPGGLDHPEFFASVFSERGIGDVLAVTRRPTGVFAEPGQFRRLSGLQVHHGERGIGLARRRVDFAESEPVAVGRESGPPAPADEPAAQSFDLGDQRLTAPLPRLAASDLRSPDVATDEKSGSPISLPDGCRRDGLRQFHTAGYAEPVFGVVDGRKDSVTNGLALGGVDTGCLDLTGVALRLWHC